MLWSSPILEQIDSLSFVNTQLRDHYPSLEEFAATYQIDAAEVISALKNIDYEYDPATNQFI